MSIKDLKSGDHVDGQAFLIGEVKTCVSNAGKQYFNITLQDSSGKIDGKKWEISPDDLAIFSPGNIVLVKGDVNLYNNALQLKILSGELASEDMDVSEFVEQAPKDEKSLRQKMIDYVKSIKDPDLYSLTSSLLKDNSKAYLRYPAATKNHHAYASGLLYHSICMADLADSICKLYPSLNRDLMISGTLLHDLGKIKELTGLIATQYSTEGKLIGHLVIAAELVSEKAKELNLDSEQILLLEHMLISHHGKLEFGAAKLPETQEALALAMIDDFDAKMEMLRIAYENVAPGEWTGRINALDGRTFYNSFFTNKTGK